MSSEDLCARYEHLQSVIQEAFQTAMNEGRNLTDAERKAGVSDAYYAWKLQSEPWLFLIDSKGVIVGRYEGGLTQEELLPALAALN